MFAVTSTCMAMCTGGSGPTPLNATQVNVLSGKLPTMTMSDIVPCINVIPFGQCSILTSMAFGVPMPCVPALAPWAPPSTCVMIHGIPAININARAVCNVGGLVQIMAPIQIQVMINR